MGTGTAFPAGFHMKIKNAIILAAGYGTRMGGCAKPLIEIGGRPLISHIISKLENIGGLENVYVVTNGLYNKNFVGWSKDLRTRLKVTLVNDGTKSNEERLGALMDIVLVLEVAYKNGLMEDTIIIAGDNFFEGGLQDILEEYSGKPLIGLQDVQSVEKAKRFGVVQLDGSNKIIGFQEKPENPKSTLVSTAIYFYPAKTLELLKEYIKGGNRADRPGDFLEWMLKNGKEVFGHIIKGKWWDIGTPESLEDAEKRYHEKGSA